MEWHGPCWDEGIPKESGRGGLVTEGHGLLTAEDIKFTLESKVSCLAGMRIL